LYIHTHTGMATASYVLHNNKGYGLLCALNGGVRV
jgi:hypothetical protein